MRGSGLRSIAPPALRRVKPIVRLTKQAHVRLGWIDYYHAHGENAALTCRHFGIARSCFFKWKQRYKARGLVGLLDQSKRPKTVRSPTTSLVVIDAIRSLRKANPEYSKYKLAIILKRDYGLVASPSTIGRVISRYQLFYTPPIRKKRHPGRRFGLERQRKPKDFTPAHPLDLIEFDVKHLPNLGTKRYGFVAIDVMTKRVAIHVASTISSTQGAIAWQKAIQVLGLPRAVMTDNGSENMGAFAKLLSTQPTEHYWARPRTPKDKPCVERFIGSLERECLQWGGVATNLDDQRSTIDSWLMKYHSYRPHESLGYLTPDEYQAKLETVVSTM